MAKKLDLNLLQALDALLAERNVTRAAVRLQTSQPALSAQLVRLRAMFDDPLLTSGSRGMTPTPRALEIGPRLAGLINEFHAIVEPERFDPATAQAIVNISSADALLNMPAAFIAGWSAQAPGIRPAFLPIERLSKPDIDSRMANGQIDIIMCPVDEIPERLHTRYITQQAYVCAMRKDHPYDKPTMTLNDLCAFNHVIVSPLGGELRNVFDDALHERGKSRRVAASIPGFMTTQQILTNSDFVAVFPRAIGQSMQATLKLYELPFEMPGAEIVLGWHERTHRSLPHRWFRERLFEMFKQTLTDDPGQHVPGARID